MNDLTTKSCQACRAGAPTATEEEFQTFLAQFSDWTVIEIDGIKRLTKTFKFGDFVKALAFTNEVGDIAESENHHPALLTEWGRVTVSWWTHKIKGLHLNDLIMAAKTDALMKRG